MDGMDLRKQLAVATSRLDEVNAFLLDPDNPAINAFLNVVAKYGTPAEINRKAAEARQLDNLLARLREQKSPYLADVEWLMEQRERGGFISVSDYRRKVVGERAATLPWDEKFAVTLEVSAAQYFPWVISTVKQALERQELVPGRFIRVRKMKEQEADQGDILAFAAAMQILGSSYVETLDTKGTDGSNVHLGGPETITGYFGGIGQPNQYPLQWLDEFLYYYTNYGVKQVLNINAGTILLGYFLHKLGVDNEFKISVYMGQDNPYAVMWTLITARLFSREDGTSPLIGFNLSNSVDNKTIELTAQIRGALGFEDVVRIEHHITETWKSIVRQPYNRRAELVELADHVANISAKHEGGDPEVEQTREHPSNILEYFIPKPDIEAQGLMPLLERNFLDKIDALNATARALTERGLTFIAARNLHLP